MQMSARLRAAAGGGRVRWAAAAAAAGCCAVRPCCRSRPMRPDPLDGTVRRVHCRGPEQGRAMGSPTVDRPRRGDSRLRQWTPAAGCGVCCGQAELGCGRLSGRLVSTADTPPQPADTAAVQGIHCYRKRSPDRRRLDGCRHRACRSWLDVPAPGTPRRSAPRAAGPPGRRAASRPPPRRRPPAGRPRPWPRCRRARRAARWSGRPRIPARRGGGRGGRSPAHTARCRRVAGQSGAAARPAPL